MYVEYPLSHWVLLLTAAVLALAASLRAGAEQPVQTPFATVGNIVVSQAEYDEALAIAMRQKYYHARPPASELEAFRREIGEALVQRALLLGEAAKRGIQPDRARVERTIADYDRRYAANPRWQAEREQLVPRLTKQLEEESLLEQLERQARVAPPATEEQARAYYERNSKEFTEPEQIRLWLIVLRVDPGAPREAWDKAREEARRLHERLLKGEDFAALAREHSADSSAERGGDLGYLHRGMLPEAIQTGVVDAMKPGDISAPVDLLEGIALLRLVERRPERLVGFDKAREQAVKGAERDAADAKWKAMIADLRSRTPIKVDETRYASATPN